MIYIIPILVIAALISIAQLICIFIPKLLKFLYWPLYTVIYIDLFFKLFYITICYFARNSFALDIFISITTFYLGIFIVLLIFAIIIGLFFKNKEDKLLVKNMYPYSRILMTPLLVSNFVSILFYYLYTKSSIVSELFQFTFDINIFIKNVFLFNSIFSIIFLNNNIKNWIERNNKKRLSQ